MILVLYDNIILIYR